MRIDVESTAAPGSNTGGRVVYLYGNTILATSEDLNNLIGPDPAAEKEERPERFSQPHQTRPSRSKNHPPVGKRVAKRRRRSKLAKMQARHTKMVKAARAKVECVVVMAPWKEALYANGRLVTVAQRITPEHVKSAGGKVVIELPAEPKWYDHRTSNRLKFPAELGDVRVAPADYRYAPKRARSRPV